MSADLIKALIEKLDDKQYFTIMRHLAQNNKRTKFPGFASLEKVPRLLVVSKATTQKDFRKNFFKLYADMILDGLVVDVTKSVSENIENTPMDKRLGVAATFLMEEAEQYEEEIAEIIGDYNTQNENDEKETPQKEEKPEKKDDKFREKYLKERKEKENFKKQLKEKQEECEVLTSRIETLKKAMEALDEEREILYQALEKRNEEINQLKSELKKSYEKTLVNKIEVKISNLRVSAPNCEDILSKYTGKIKLDFSDISEKTKEELLEKFDQIWILSSAVAYAARRKLFKLKKEGLENIFFFSNIASLIEKAKDITQ